MNSRGTVVIVLDTAHVALGQTLINDENDLGAHLRAKEHSFLGAMASLRRTWACTGARSIAVALILEFGEILGKPQGLD